MITLMKRFAIFFASAIVSFVLVVMLSPILLVPFGFKSATVMSGSMTPTINMGDVVIERPIEPAAARIGDVVTFTDPNDDSRLLTHRVRRIKVRGGVFTFTTKGDANNTAEKWHIPADGTIGRVSWSIPKIGFIVGSHRGPWLRFSFVVIPALIWAVYELVNIWRPKGPAPDPRARRAPGVPPPPPRPTS